MTERFDHVVIGGGASGCAAAAKLVTQGGARVLLLEAGYSHRHPLLDMPPGIFKMINGSKFMRYHHTVPQEHLAGRVHDIPQGHVLGGGTSVNAQVYMRGRPSDYDEWDRLLRGDNDYPGWSWADVLPHFRAMEGNARLHDERHGTRGAAARLRSRAYRRCLALVRADLAGAWASPYNHDFNGPSQRGVGFYQFMNRNGRRSSAAYAFLAPLEKDPRLTIRLRSPVQRIEIENGRATGVVYRDAEGREHRVAAEAEILLAAGALVTPQILMLSGIGPAAQLAAHGIACIADLPGVGENLIDHPELPMIALANGRHGYYRQGVGLRMLLNGLQFKLFRSGRILSAGVEAGAFVNPVDPDGRAERPGFLRADRLSGSRHAFAREGCVRRHDHHRRDQAEIARHRAPALGGSARHAARLAEPAARPR